MEHYPMTEFRTQGLEYLRMNKVVCRTWHFLMHSKNFRPRNIFHCLSISKYLFFNASERLTPIISFLRNTWYVHEDTGLNRKATRTNALCNGFITPITVKFCTFKCIPV